MQTSFSFRHCMHAFFGVALSKAYVGTCKPQESSYCMPWRDEQVGQYCAYFSWNFTVLGWRRTYPARKTSNSRSLENPRKLAQRRTDGSGPPLCCIISDRISHTLTLSLSLSLSYSHSLLDLGWRDYKTTRWWSDYKTTRWWKVSRDQVVDVNMACAAINASSL